MSEENKNQSISPKQKMIEEITTLLSQKAKELHDDETISLESKLS